MKNRNHIAFFILFELLAFNFLSVCSIKSQSWDLTPENINIAIRDSSININKDPSRPGYHLVPPVGCMGDPNGGIFYNGWYHIFYGLQPFSHRPGGWYWAHARSRDLLHWEHVKTGLTPAFELGLYAVGSGSTIITDNGQKVAFYSESKNGKMKFWRAQFTDEDLSEWNHEGKNPVLTLEHPGLPPFDGFWRDPYVFKADGRFFLIACADLLDENYVMVPVFEAKDKDLTEWMYKGELFRVLKNKYRNLEVPQFCPLADKWIFMASTDAPIDRVNYFIGRFDIDKLQFFPEIEGSVDYSGHYYAQEGISDDNGNLFLLSWIPGWDREWLPMYMNEPPKNSNLLWNGCFSLPRKIDYQNGQLIQRPAEALTQLRTDHFQLEPRELPVDGPMTAFYPVNGFKGNQIEINIVFDLHNASFCGINLLADSTGTGGIYIIWSGDLLNIDGVHVPIKEYPAVNELYLEIFVDKKIVEVFVNGGRYCVTRQIKEEHIKGEHLSLTVLGGTARLISFDGWKLKTLNR